MDILIASHNQGKILEIKKYFENFSINFFDLKSLDIHESISEPYDTFQQNSFHKADYYSSISGMLVLADDSGLEVECLNGKPGVLSARYGGDHLSDHERNLLLLDEISDFNNIKAKFKCVLTLCKNQEWVSSFEGECEGLIIGKEKGSNGFGYDPIFFLEKYAKTMAEIDTEIKNKISHRAIALNKLSKFLESLK
jgi:XTP/dITP diphosphohydrolase